MSMITRPVSTRSSSRNRPEVMADLTGKEEKCLLIFSGGQDSTTCLYWARDRFRQIYAVTFYYGQRHRLEIAAAEEIGRFANVTEHEVIDVRGMLESASPLTDFSRDVGQYESAEELPGGLEPTFIPARNILFLTIAANRAYAKGIRDIVIGVSAVDYGGYPDCRPQFLHLMEEAVNAGLEAEMRFHAPLINLTKKETVLLAAEMTGCFEALSLSHTCYKGEFPPCGQCHACLLREKGFREAGLEDPLLTRVKGGYPLRRR
jgi:7-cyano-7-deazaguanine synthase